MLHIKKKIKNTLPHHTINEHFIRFIQNKNNLVTVSLSVMTLLCLKRLRHVNTKRCVSGAVSSDHKL